MENFTHVPKWTARYDESQSSRFGYQLRVSLASSVPSPTSCLPIPFSSESWHRIIWGINISICNSNRQRLFKNKTSEVPWLYLKIKNNFIISNIVNILRSVVIQTPSVFEENSHFAPEGKQCDLLPVSRRKGCEWQRWAKGNGIVPGLLRTPQVRAGLHHHKRILSLQQYWRVSWNWSSGSQLGLRRGLNWKVGYPLHHPTLLSLTQILRLVIPHALFLLLFIKNQPIP